MPAITLHQGVEVMPGLESPLAVAMGDRDRAALAMVREAVVRKRALLAFQPVVRARQPDQPAFWEALVRIRDDRDRVIPAGDFINVVETSELGRQIDCLSLELGFAALAEEPSLRLAVNMSARSIGYPAWTRMLKRGLAADPTAGERLILEITETSAMMMPEIVRVFMDESKAEGIAFAIDDFGAGFTAFRYFRDFDFDILKIDGQFIRGVARSPDNQVLTRAMVSIAGHFGMFSVAEQVESAEDAAWLASEGVDCLQGYHLGAPTLRPWWREPAERLPAR